MRKDLGLRSVVALLVSLLMCTTPAIAIMAGEQQVEEGSPMAVEEMGGPIDNNRVETTILELNDEREGAGKIGPTDVKANFGTSNEGDPTGYTTQRKLLRDFNEILYAVYTKSGEVHIANSTDVGISWSASKILNIPGTYGKHPALAISGNHIYVAWEEGPNISLRRSPDRGVTWMPPLVDPPIILETDFVNNPKSPVIAATNLNVVVAWAGYDGGTSDYEIQMRRSSDNGSVWDPKVALSNTGIPTYYPSISASGNDYYLAFQNGVSGSRDILFRYSNDDGQTWNPAISTPINVSSSSGDSILPCIIDKDGSVYLVWMELSVGNSEVLFKKSLDGGQNWDGTSTFVSDTPAARSYGPSIAVAENDDLYVIWSDQIKHPHNDTFIRRFNATSGSWASPFKHTDLDVGYSYLTINPYANSTRIEWLYTLGRVAPYRIQYTYQMITGNQAPAVEWTGEVGYEDRGLDTETGGTTAHTYNFRVNYTDPDNNEPMGGAVRLLVDYNQDGFFDIYDEDEYRLMYQVSSGDTDYTNGKIYAYSMKFPGTGQDYRYRFYARDSMNNMATGIALDPRPYPDINIVDHEPRLFWTNEKGYSSDGVEPESGTSSTNFTWHVSYFDEDDNPPMLGYPKLLVDINNNTIYEASEQFNMTELDPDDNAFDDGKFYSYSRPLPNVGTYKYRFMARDIWGILNPTDDKPYLTNDGPTVTTINTAPILAFPIGTGFSNDGLDPNTGSTSRLFTYRIVYTDAENNPPASGYPKVWIDINLDTLITADEKFVMTEENASDKDYSNGKIYTYEMYFSDVGSYRYKFEARDIYDQQATGQAASLLMGPDVTKLNDAPTLLWSATTGFETDGVYPEKGRNTTVFTFRVEYKDPNNDAPLTGYPRVWIDKDLDKNLDIDEVFEMVAAESLDTTFDDGKDYTYRTTLDLNGRYSYKFEAWDGFDGYASGPATKLVGGPDVGTSYNNPPTLSWVGTSGYENDGIEPDSGPNTETFTYAILYTDLDDDVPDQNFPKLYFDLTGNGDYNDSNERQVMYEEDGEDQTYSDGKVYVFETDLTTSFTKVGSSYTYYYSAQDSKGIPATGVGTRKTFGPNITTGNTPPNLEWVGDENYEGDGLHPHNGNATMVFIFRVKYIDSDNDPPKPDSPKVYIDHDPLGKLMEKEDSSDNDYTDGVVYTYKTTLSLGNHFYRFIAFDQFSTKAPASDRPMQSSEGPLVEENEPPVLAWPTGDIYTLGVDPKKGEPGTKFTFKVVYTDPEGDKPATGYPRLLIDRNNDGDFDDSLEVLELEWEVGNDPTYGMTYSIEIILEKGKHSYRFEAKDMKGNTAKGDPTVLQEGTVKVSPAQVQTGPGMMTYILIILIIVAAVAGLAVGMKMGGGKPPKAKKPEDTGATTVDPAYPPPEAYQDQGGYGEAYQYGYDQSQAGYYQQQEQAQPDQTPPQEPPRALSAEKPAHPPSPPQQPQPAPQQTPPQMDQPPTPVPPPKPAQHPKPVQPPKPAQDPKPVQPPKPAQ